jgi:hypothetical protein
MDPTVKAYAGFALDREFSEETKAATNGRKIDAATLKGTTGIGEVGLTAMPSLGRPLFRDFEIQGITPDEEKARPEA